MGKRMKAPPYGYITALLIDRSGMGRHARPGKEQDMKYVDADLMISILQAENEKLRHRRTNADEEIQQIFREKIIELLKKTEAVLGWKDPETDPPRDGGFVLVIVSGENAAGDHRYDHAVEKGSYLPGDGWLIEADIDDFVVHQWCEIPGGYDTGDRAWDAE